MENDGIERQMAHPGWDSLKRVAVPHLVRTIDGLHHFKVLTNGSPYAVRVGMPVQDEDPSWSPASHLVGSLGAGGQGSTAGVRNPTTIIRAHGVRLAGGAIKRAEYRSAHWGQDRSEKRVQDGQAKGLGDLRLGRFAPAANPSEGTADCPLYDTRLN